MTTGNVNFNTQSLWMNQQTGNDSFIWNIQRQIENKQKELQNLSKLEDMSLEDKMKKRQEIQQEIADLYNQLRQYQIEQRMKQKSSSMDDKLGRSNNSQAAENQNNGTAISHDSMKALISADSSMKQAKVRRRVAAEMNGRAVVLESEIKQDKGRGVNTEKKEEELSKIKENVQTTVSSIMSTLADANEMIKENGKAAEKNTDNSQSSSAARQNCLENQKETWTEANRELGTATGTANSDVTTGAGEKITTSQPINYTPVDIYL